MNKIRKEWKLALIMIVLCFCFYSCFSSKEKPEAESPDVKILTPMQKAESQRLRTLINNNIRSISADQNSVWVATLSGVSKLDRAANRWTHYTKDDGLGSDAVHAVVSEGKRVWFGTEDGLTLYDVEKGSWRTFKEKDGLRGGSVNTDCSHNRICSMLN